MGEPAVLVGGLRLSGADDHRARQPVRRRARVHEDRGAIAFGDVLQPFEVRLHGVAERPPHRQPELIAADGGVAALHEVRRHPPALAAERPVAIEDERRGGIRVTLDDPLDLLLPEVDGAGNMGDRVFARRAHVEHGHRAGVEQRLQLVGADLGRDRAAFPEGRGADDGGGRGRGPPRRAGRPIRRPTRRAARRRRSSSSFDAWLLPVAAQGGDRRTKTQWTEADLSVHRR